VYVYLGINTVKSIIILLTDANMILKPDKVKRLHGITLMKCLKECERARGLLKYSGQWKLDLLAHQTDIRLSLMKPKVQKVMYFSKYLLLP
jgi:hypothetical protein